MESLINKIMNRKKLSIESDPVKINIWEGYLFLMEKNASGSTWAKHYCTYQKDKKEFTMMPYNKVKGKFNHKDSFTTASCIQRQMENRFCFDITAVERPGIVYTFQALSENDRKTWIDAMDGKE